MDSAKIFIGLGNPGRKYQNNRHNVGKMFIDYWIKKISFQKFEKLKEKNKSIAEILKANGFFLVKTNTFMNLSGKAVKKIIEDFKLKIENLYIIHDDLDIPLGKFKIQFAVGPKLHRGIKSIEEALKTKSFWRIRIGVDARKKENWVDGEAYVLQDFLNEEKSLLKDDVFPKILNTIRDRFILTIR